jgi:hypothetical protein
LKCPCNENHDEYNFSNRPKDCPLIEVYHQTSLCYVD